MVLVGACLVGEIIRQENFIRCTELKMMLIRWCLILAIQFGRKANKYHTTIQLCLMNETSPLGTLYFQPRFLINTHTNVGY